MNKSSDKSKMDHKQRFISCEICGCRAFRQNSEKRMFMAKFPKDEERCKQWVKVVGKEDLIYVPIEKLNSLKYVCGDHFGDKEFNRKKNRLKKSAIPTKNLRNDALPDEMLIEFPCHIATDSPSRIYDNEDLSIEDDIINNHNKTGTEHDLNKKERIEDHTYCKSNDDEAVTHSSHQVLHLFPNPDTDKERFNTWLYAIGGDILGLENERIYKYRRVCHNHFDMKYLCRNNRISKIALPTFNIPGPLVPQKYTFGANKPMVQTRNIRPPLSIGDDANHCSPLEEEPHQDQPPEESVHSWQRDADDRSPLEEPHEEQPLEEECIYSWQKHDAVVPCDADVAVIAEEGRRSPSVPRTIGATESAHLNVRCNVCENEIFGFRYVCVQCPDYDLCSTCEARRAHSAHYVLRVPGPRPESELQQVLRAIRQALAASILQLQDQVPVEVKDEVQDSPEHCSTADELQTHRTDAQLRTDDESDTSSDSQDDELDYSCTFEESELPVDPEEITQPQKIIVMPKQIQDCNRPIMKHLHMVRQHKDAVKRTHPFSEEPAAKTRMWDTPPSPPGPSSLGLSQTGPVQPTLSLLRPSLTGSVQPRLSLLRPSPSGPIQPRLSPLRPSPSGPIQPRLSPLRPSLTGPVQPRLKLLRPSPPGPEQPAQLLKVYNPLGVQPREAYVALRRLQLPPSESNKYFIEKIS